MTLLEMRAFDERELLDRLRRVRLKGHGQPAIYANAELTLERGVDPDQLAPAQRYVLAPGVRRTLALREALRDRGVDLFALEGGVWIRTADNPDEEIPVIPPVVEASVERDGRTVLLINDGMHRTFAARMAGSPINVVVVRGVSPDYPYYAYALEEGWADVQELESLPEGFAKKTYRDPKNYKALFRDFNSPFPGVQAQRAPTPADKAGV